MLDAWFWVLMGVQFLLCLLSIKVGNDWERMGGRVVSGQTIRTMASEGGVAADAAQHVGILAGLASFFRLLLLAVIVFVGFRYGWLAGVLVLIGSWAICNKTLRAFVFDVIGMPKVGIVICGVIGAWFWGTWGAFGGLAAGYVLAMILGALVGVVWGGAIPKKWREDVAEAFLASHADLARDVFPISTDASLRESVSASANEVFRLSQANNARQGERAFGYGYVHEAYVSIRDAEPSSRKKEYWDALWITIARVVYAREPDA